MPAEFVNADANHDISLGTMHAVLLRQQNLALALHVIFLFRSLSLSFSLSFALSLSVSFELSSEKLWLIIIIVTMANITMAMWICWTDQSEEGQKE